MHLTLPSILLATSLCLHSVVAAPVAAPEDAISKRTPDPLMISNPFGLGEDGDGGVGIGGGADGGWITDPPGLTPTDPGNAYQMCYTIYSSPKLKRGLDLSDNDIEKRCRKVKSKREALMISNPFGLGEDGDGGVGLGGGGDGGADPKWPGDVGEGFLQCYQVYYSQKRDEGEGGLEKRCGKEKRELVDEILKREKPKFSDYKKYIEV